MIVCSLWRSKATILTEELLYQYSFPNVLDSPFLFSSFFRNFDNWDFIKQEQRKEQQPNHQQTAEEKWKAQHLTRTVSLG